MRIIPNALFKRKGRGCLRLNLLDAQFMGEYRAFSCFYWCEKERYALLCATSDDAASPLCP